MKFTTQEEYGLRLLVRLGFAKINGQGLTIPEISTKEQITEPNVAKILRVLRLAGFLESERGRLGGYSLTKNPDEINIGEVMSILGNKFFDSSYCENQSSTEICTHSLDCSIRSFWKIIQQSIDTVINKLTLEDLMGTEKQLFEGINKTSTSDKTN